jgi:hypothetical protein
MEHSPASVVADAAENLSGDPLLHIVHTKEGVKAACMALAYGTAKDRKKALKCMKVSTVKKAWGAGLGAWWLAVWARRGGRAGRGGRGEVGRGGVQVS